MYRGDVWNLSTLIATVLFGTTCLVAKAELPADQAVKFSIHETPDNPRSAVAFVVELELTAINTNGNLVGWKITEARFWDSAEGDPKWIEDSPVLDTGDGLWWIDHNNAQDPQLSEFVNLPYFEGTADAESAWDDNLEYELEGDFFSGTPPYDVTGAATGAFTLEGEPEPELVVDDDPVELEGGEGTTG